jgi:hypothetical protein
MWEARRRACKVTLKAGCNFRIARRTRSISKQLQPTRRSHRRAGAARMSQLISIRVFM